MSLRNGMWHGLRNDIIMCNVKEMNNTENCTLFWRQSIHRQLFNSLMLRARLRHIHTYIYFIYARNLQSSCRANIFEKIS